MWVFGLPQGFADISQSKANGGVVHIGSSARTIPNVMAYQDPFRYAANIFSSSGNPISKVNLRNVSLQICFWDYGMTM